MSERNITLYYFDTKGVGEPTRLLLAIGGIAFTDVRYGLDDFTQDKNLKARLPFGQVPALEVDGVVLAQKESIARFAAKLAGLYPTDPVDAARVDMIVVYCNDVLAETTKMIFDGVPGAPGTEFVPDDERDRMLAAWSEERLPEQLNRLEQLAVGATMATESMTWADVCVFNFFDRVRGLIPDVQTGGWPKLEAVRHSVAAHPGVQRWMREHPNEYPTPA